MSDPSDILAHLDDPRVLEKILKEIDKDGNHTLDKKELTEWITKHASEIKVGDHTLADDLKKFGPGALAAEDAHPAVDFRYQQDADGHKKGQLNQEAYKEYLHNRNNVAKLENEISDVTTNLQEALTNNTHVLQQLDATKQADVQVQKEHAENVAGANTVNRMIQATLHGKINPANGEQTLHTIQQEEQKNALAGVTAKNPTDPVVQEVADQNVAQQKTDPQGFAKMIAHVSEDIAGSRALLQQYQVLDVNKPHLDDFRPLITPNQPAPDNSRQH